MKRSNNAVAMTGAVRGVAQSFGPVLAGLAIGAASFGLPFFAGGGLKVIYDLALFAGFFIYISASDLLPESYHDHPTIWTTAMTILGMAVVYVAVNLAQL